MNKLIETLKNDFELLLIANKAKYIGIDEFAYETGFKKLELMKIIKKYPDLFYVSYNENSSCLCIYDIELVPKPKLVFVYYNNKNSNFYIYTYDGLGNTKDKIDALIKLNIFVDFESSNLLVDNWDKILIDNGYEYKIYFY